jgi:hypothetical protein
VRGILGTTALCLALAAAVTGCGDDSSAVPATDGSSAAEELTPGWDESPDSAPVPDSRLTADQLTALLRSRATAPGNPAHCGPEDVRAELSGFGAAAGHRMTRVLVRNTSDRLCLVEGVPGVGARGAWGNRFLVEVDERTGEGPAVPVQLAPGDAAAADLEWSGALAGAEQEHASLLVVQLAEGQVPVAVPARIAGDPADAPPLDIGVQTAITMSPFEPVA